MYVVGRQDLSIEQQGVQNGHAAINFIFEHFNVAKKWNEESNYLIYLSVDDELKLQKLLQKAEFKGIKTTSFYEPDINNELTAVAFEPSTETKKLVSGLPLMRKEVSLCL